MDKTCERTICLRSGSLLGYIRIVAGPGVIAVSSGADEIENTPLIPLTVSM